MSEQNVLSPLVDDDLAIGTCDMIQEIPLELLRVMANNSRELEHLPRELLVNVPSNKG